MSESIKKKINDLENEIRLHQKYYYFDNKPKISDKEFDILFKELQSLEKSYPDYVSKNSPTKIVGSDLDNTFEKYKHKIPVLSLENTYSSEELIEWATKLSSDEIFSFEWKVDCRSSLLLLFYL